MAAYLVKKCYIAYDMKILSQIGELPMESLFESFIITINP